MTPAPSTWRGRQRSTWRRREGTPIIELICAENHNDYFSNFAAPIPEASKTDF
jgi:hypothetical protein